MRIIFILLFLFSSTVIAQEKKVPAPPGKPYVTRTVVGYPPGPMVVTPLPERSMSIKLKEPKQEPSQTVTGNNQEDKD